MKLKILFIIIFILPISPCFAQMVKSGKLKSHKTKIVRMSSQSTLSDEEQKQQAELDRMNKEASYYAPVR